LIGVLRYISLTLPPIISLFASVVPLLSGLLIGVNILVRYSSKRPSISEFVGDSSEPSVGLDILVEYSKSLLIRESKYESSNDREDIV
jgi:hypothetical protein